MSTHNLDQAKRQLQDLRALRAELNDRLGENNARLATALLNDDREELAEARKERRRIREGIEDCYAVAPYLEDRVRELRGR